MPVQYSMGVAFSMIRYDKPITSIKTYIFKAKMPLASDPFPEAWGNCRVLSHRTGFILVLLSGVVLGGLVEC